MNNIQSPSQNCQQCHGKGYHEADLKNLGKGTIERHIVNCLHPTCKNGKVDPELKRIYVESWQNWGKA